MAGGCLRAVTRNTLMSDAGDEEGSAVEVACNSTNAVPSAKGGKTTPTSMGVDAPADSARNAGLSSPGSKCVLPFESRKKISCVTGSVESACSENDNAGESGTLARFATVNRK